MVSYQFLPLFTFTRWLAAWYFSVLGRHLRQHLLESAEKDWRAWSMSPMKCDRNRKGFPPIVTSAIKLFFEPFSFSFWIYLINFEINSHEQAREATLTRHCLATRSHIRLLADLRVDPRVPRELASTQPGCKPPRDSSQWTSCGQSEWKRRRTTKMTPSLSARTTWIELRTQRLSKLRISSCKKRDWWTNKKRLLWPNPRQRSKKWSRWMNRELKKCNQQNNRSTSTLRTRRCSRRPRRRWTTSLMTLNKWTRWSFTPR